MDAPYIPSMIEKVVAVVAIHQASLLLIRFKDDERCFWKLPQKQKGRNHGHRSCARDCFKFLTGLAIAPERFELLTPQKLEDVLITPYWLDLKQDEVKRLPDNPRSMLVESMMAPIAQLDNICLSPVDANFIRTFS